MKNINDKEYILLLEYLSTQRLSGATREVYLILLKSIRQFGYGFSKKSLIKQTGFSKRTVERALAKLKQLKILVYWPITNKWVLNPLWASEQPNYRFTQDVKIAQKYNPDSIFSTKKEIVKKQIFNNY